MPHKKKEKSKFIINLEYYVFMTIVTGVRTLPLKVNYFIAGIVSWLLYQFDLKHSHRSVRHILHSGILTDKKAAKKLARENFRHILKVFIEIVKFDQLINDENFDQHITVADDPISQKWIRKGTAIPIILTTAHLGNWELAGGTHSRISGIPMCSIMRPLANYRIGEYFYKHRSSYQHRTVSKENGLRQLLMANKKGEDITIVADQHASHSEGVEVMFFGQPARAHATPALLHLKTKTPIAMPYLLRKDDNFNFEFHCGIMDPYTPTGDKETDIKNITQLYTNMIEREIRKNPVQWLWPHRRWLNCGRGRDDYQFGDDERAEKAKAKEDATHAEAAQ